MLTSAHLLGAATTPQSRMMRITAERGVAFKDKLEADSPGSVRHWT
jgi:hypothetical protein